MRYRVDRGLLDGNEQMALLVMRVSGSQCGDTFFPHLAGVGFSFNPYVWHKDIDPRAGVVRLVFGLGTRAVDRHLPARPALRHVSREWPGEGGGRVLAAG